MSLQLDKLNRTATEAALRIARVRRALFFGNIALLLGMVLTIGGTNYYADPFAVLQHTRSTAAPVSKSVNPILAKLADYRTSGGANLLLGDSRMDRVDVAYASQVAGVPFSNLAIE